MAHRLTDSGIPPTFGTQAPGFAFECPVSVFKAESEPEGRKRRIGGIISTENPDRQKEVILQDGLTFDEFLKHGWFNDNHSQGTTDILGYPDSVKSFKRGETLPDGTTAESNGTWVEGYILPTKKGDEIWELAQGLKNTDRRLGYSVEGSIEERSGPADNIIAKAKVRNVAITNCPVNTDARLEILARSLAAYGKVLNRSMSMTDAQGSAGPVKPNRPYTGRGAGQAISKESLAGAKRKRKHQPLTRSEAVAYVKSQIPGVCEAWARALVSATLNPLGRGK